jgi:1-acyl-sn-glycerol-3-phosphate acyltransferase
MAPMTTTDAAAVTRGTAARPTLLWRLLLVLARLVVGAVARLRITGEVPQGLRGGPLVLASNHIGLFDPIALSAACRVRGLAPSFLATAGLFEAPLVGAVMRGCGHIPVDRQNGGGGALDASVGAVRRGAVVAAYPEGRISLDPGLWPEHGRTGAARLALLTGVPVVPVAQWGAHEVLAYDGYGAMLRTLARAIVRRPVVRVHFGAPVDLSGLDVEVPGDAQRAADRITAATVDALRVLRADEPAAPRVVDPTRPLSTARSFGRG